MRNGCVTRVGHALPLQPIGLMTLLVALGLGGCATTWQPIADTQRVALMPSKGEITMVAQPGKPIGNMVPVDVAVANGTEEPYRIEPDQVFAINAQGQRVAPIPANEAIVQAGRANALKAGLVGAAKHALGDGIAGAAAGAAVGTIIASPAQGALLGAAMGGSVGAVSGGIFGGLQGRAAAHNDAESQISSLSLQTRDANPDYSVNGYVFFPKGNYTAVEMKLFDEETHESAIRSSPWARNGWTSAASSIAPVGLVPNPSRPANSPSPASLRDSQEQPLPPTRIE